LFFEDFFRRQECRQNYMDNRFITVGFESRFREGGSSCTIIVVPPVDI
jgi:hypothetical protein